MTKPVQRLQPGAAPPTALGRIAFAAALALLGGAIVIQAGHAPAGAQIAVRNQGYVPFSDAPINYRSHPLSDPVALLQRDIDQGRVKLTYDKDRGYLASVLKALKIPASSQTLVFSKTSFQFTKISTAARLPAALRLAAKLSHDRLAELDRLRNMISRCGLREAARRLGRDSSNLRKCLNKENNR